MKDTVKEMQALVDELSAAETLLQHLKQFQAEGGEHRLQIVAEHSNALVAHAVQSVGLSIGVKAKIVEGLVHNAGKQVADARHNLLTYAMAAGLDTMGGAAP